jgi:hypothetical protein
LAGERAVDADEVFAQHKNRRSVISKSKDFLLATLTESP